MGCLLYTSASSSGTDAEGIVTRTDFEQAQDAVDGQGIDVYKRQVPASQIASEELYNASLRNVPSLGSRDLDGDGTVEIPTQPDEAGLLNMSQSRRMDFIVWRCV